MNDLKPNISQNNLFERDNEPKQLSFQYLKISFTEFVRSCRSSRKLVLLVVFIALFFDNMLLTTVGNSRLNLNFI